MKPEIKSNSVAILGFHDGAAGQVEAWFEDVTGFHLACFVHEAPVPLEVDAEGENKKRISQRTEFPVGGMFKGRPLIVALDWADQLERAGIGKVLPLTPDNRERHRQIEACRRRGFELVSAIHPTAIILDDAKIAPGVWINAGSMIGYKAEIEAGVIVNSGAQIDHHNVLRACCQVDPGVVTAGFVALGDCSHIHTGAVIINRVEIGADAVIGAGSVVLENIPAGCTAVGVPAKIIKHS